MERPRPQPRIILQTADVRIAEYTLAPGEGQPWHRHTEVTDRFYCLAGTIEVALRDPASSTVLHPGETCAVPVGTVHRAANAGDAASRYLLIQGIGKYDFVKAG